MPAPALHTALFATIGVALGALARNPVAAIAGALAHLAIVEHTLVNLVPAVGRSPAPGVGVLAAYAVVAGLAALRLERTRDA